MYRLFYSPGNANLAPHMLLNELGVAFELALVDRASNAQKSAGYLKINPLGRVPALQDGELTVIEATAICLHLVDRHPQAGLAPALGTATRAHFYQWMAYLTNTLQAELMTFFYPERLAPDAALAAQIKAAAEVRAGTMLEYVDHALAQNGGQFLVGDGVTAADFYLLMLARWTRHFAKSARSYPTIGPYLLKLLERPSVQKTFVNEGITAPLV